MSLPTDLILHTWSFCDMKTLLCGCLVTNREWSECVKANLLGPIAAAMSKRVQNLVLNRPIDCQWQCAKPLANVVFFISIPDCPKMTNQLREECPSLLGFSVVPELLRQSQQSNNNGTNGTTIHSDLIAALATNVEIMVFNVASQLQLYQQHWKKNYAGLQYESNDYLTTQLQRHGYKSVPNLLEDFSASVCDCCSTATAAATANDIACKYHALEKLLLHKDVCKGSECKDRECLTIQRQHFIQADSLQCSQCRRQETRVTLEFRRFMFPLLMTLLSPSTSHIVHEPRIKCDHKHRAVGCYCTCTWDFCSKDCAWSFMLDHALCDKDGDFLVPCVHFLRSSGIQFKWQNSFPGIPVNPSVTHGFIKIGCFIQYEYCEHLVGLCNPATCNGPSLMKMHRRYLEHYTSIRRPRK